MQQDIASIRTGRASASLVENIEILVYGGTDKLRLVELGTISAPDTQTIVIEPWDKSIIGEIKRGIMAANVGFNPSIDGELLRLTLPPLTTEDREKYVKLLSGKLESGKVMIRKARAQAMHSIKNELADKKISQDQRRSQEKDLQKSVDEYVGKIEGMGEAKKKELLGL